LDSPILNDPHASGLKAVDAKVAPLVLVADGERESAVVGPDEVDGTALVAVNAEGGALAAILGATSGRGNRSG
jgi:propanediol dehydratase large subunit